MRMALDATQMPLKIGDRVALSPGSGEQYPTGHVVNFIDGLQPDTPYCVVLADTGARLELRAGWVRYLSPGAVSLDDLRERAAWVEARERHQRDLWETTPIDSFTTRRLRWSPTSSTTTSQWRLLYTNHRPGDQR